MNHANSFKFSAHYDIHLKIAIKAPISLIKFLKNHLSCDLECLIEENVPCPELPYKAARMSPALFYVPKTALISTRKPSHKKTSYPEKPLHSVSIVAHIYKRY